MPGVEVLDDAVIPLLIDRFPYPAVYQGFQLYQRGVRWKTLQQGLEHRFSHSLRELLDEWAIGFEVGSSVEEQTERELIQKLADPSVLYLDYFTGDYDHVAHLTSDPAAQRLAPAVRYGRERMPEKLPCCIRSGHNHHLCQKSGTYRAV
jgi:hypothetical protein